MYKFSALGKPSVAAKRWALLIGASVCAIALVNGAHAQSFDQPNPFIAIDENGVDLATGEYNFPSLTLSLGSGDSGIGYEAVLGRDPYSGYAETGEQGDYVVTNISYGNSSFLYAHGTYHKSTTYSTVLAEGFSPIVSYSFSQSIAGSFATTTSNTSQMWLTDTYYNGPTPGPNETVEVWRCGQDTNQNGQIINCYSIKITKSTMYYNVRTDYYIRDTYADGRFDQLSGPVAHLRAGSLTGEYFLTLASGEVAYYKDQILRKVTKPNGEVVDIEYYLNGSGYPITKVSAASVRYYSYRNKNSSGQYLSSSTVTQAVKRSVKSTAGWALNFHVDASNGLAKVVGWNRAAGYCGSDFACPDTLTGTQISDFRDLDGYRWVYVNGVRGGGYNKSLGAINVSSPMGRLKSFTKDVVTIQGTQYEVRLTGATVRGQSWDYDYVDVNPTVIGGNYTLNRQNPLGQVFQLKYGFDGPTETTDELNRKTSVFYDGYRIKDVVTPAGSTTAGTGGTYPGSSRYTYDTRGNITSVKSISNDGSGAELVQTAHYPATCDEMTAKFCNKPEWVRSANANLPANASNADMRTDFTYSSVHGGIVTETLPANGQGVRLRTTYEYQPLYAQVQGSSGLGNAETPIYKVVKVSSCASTQTACDQAADTVTEYEYAHNNLLVTAKTVRAGNVNVSQAYSATNVWQRETYGYDGVGNMVWVDGPLPGDGDKSYVTYDALRRKVLEISADPDGSGPLKRQVAKHEYDADGFETRTESATCRDVTFTNGVPTGCSEYAWSTAKRMTYDDKAQLVKTEVVVP